MPAALDIIPQPFHHHSQVGILRSQNARDGELDIVVGTIVVTVHVLGRQRPDVDPDRVYIYGMSMGGIGAFEMPDFMEWMFSKSKKKILN